jgi:hypothetical protein
LLAEKAPNISTLDIRRAKTMRRILRFMKNNYTSLQYKRNTKKCTEKSLPEKQKSIIV